MVEWTRMAGAVLVVLLCGCSGGGDRVGKDLPAVGSACQTEGDSACGVDAYDRSVLLVCGVSVGGDLLWRMARVCPGGCRDSRCLDVEVITTPDSLPGETTDGFDADSTSGDSDQKNGEGTDPEICQPDCTGKGCGPDGCGGSCGSCPTGTTCPTDGSACCTPSCFGKSCGDDGCGGSCGTCPNDLVCNFYFQCAPVCQPNCGDRECGPDGCGKTCGECLAGTACGSAGLCSICVPQCEGKNCGDNGCGGFCGGCIPGYDCINHQCVPQVCTPSCVGKQCGSNGCTGSCGTCQDGKQCVNFSCQHVCTPQCTNRVCGPDGCGGNCGKCPPWAWCTAAGQCDTDCVPSCVRPDGTIRNCGSDGCGGLCGGCPSGQYCSPNGDCRVPDGPCGSITAAGWCDGNYLLACVQNMVSALDCATHGKNVYCEWIPAESRHGCVPHGECVPQCGGKVCGSNGCGGSCGQCPYPQTCEFGQCIGTTQCGEVGFHGCCSGNTVLWCDSGSLWHMNCDQMVQPAQRFCGWNADLGFYDCISAHVQGPPEHPYYCGGPCVPNCTGKQCGEDGCGGSCGQCPFGLVCQSNQCKGQDGGCGGYTASASCQGDMLVWCENNSHVLFMDCSAMGSFYHCGWVPELFSNWCYQEECIPDCLNKQCGDDGCGYTCGYCPSTMTCNNLFQCVYGAGFCGDIDFTGVCDGNTVKWCQAGVLQTFNCNSLGPGWNCGWFEGASGAYWWCIQN